MTVPLRLSQNRQKITIGITIAAWLGRGYVLLADFRHTWRLTAWFCSYIFVHGFPGSRLFKMTFPESRFVKLSNPVSRSKLQSRISLPIFYKIPNPGLQKSQIPDPETPIGDPLYCVGFCSHKIELRGWLAYCSPVIAPRGLLQISSDGDDRRIFWVEIFDSMIFLGRKICLVFFCVVWFTERGFKLFFWGVFKTIRRFVVVPAHPGRIQLNLFCCCFNI